MCTWAVAIPQLFLSASEFYKFVLARGQFIHDAAAVTTAAAYASRRKRLMWERYSEIT